jgi:hypothetical protein
MPADGLGKIRTAVRISVIVPAGASSVGMYLQTLIL